MKLSSVVTERSLIRPMLAEAWIAVRNKFLPISGTVRADALMYLFGSLSLALGQWAVFVLGVKFCPGEVGRLAIVTAVSQPVVILLGMQLRTILVSGHKNLEPSVFFCTRCFTGCVLVATAFAASFLLGDEGEYSAVIIGVAVVKAVEGVADILHGFWQREGNAKRVFVSSCLRAGLSVSVFGAVVAVTGSITAGVFGLAVVTATVLVVHDIPLVWHGVRTSVGCAEPMVAANLIGRAIVRNSSAVPHLLNAGAFMGASAFINAIITNIPRYQLELAYGQNQVGVFTGLTHFNRIGIFFEAALISVLLPKLAGAYALGNKAVFLRLITKMCLFVLAVGATQVLVFCLFGEGLLGFIYNKEYSACASAMVLMTVASIFGSLAGVWKAGADACGVFVSQLSVFALTGLFSLGLSAFLVPELGILGAAWTVVFTKAFLAVGFCYLFLRKARQIPRLAATNATTVGELAA